MSIRENRICSNKIFLKEEKAPTVETFVVGFIYSGYGENRKVPNPKIEDFLNIASESDYFTITF